MCQPACRQPLRRACAHRLMAAFTLIELLVVVAVISVLASMLLPALSRARDKARQTTCIGNTRQTLLALRMYADDREEGFPFWYSNNPTPCYDWIKSLIDLRYANSEQALQCTATPFNYGFANYVATWNINSGACVPADKRFGAWFLYFARPKGSPFFNPNGNFNGPIVFSNWGAHIIQGDLSGKNLSQVQHWQYVPDHESTLNWPIVNCPPPRGLPPTPAGGYAYPQSSWTYSHPHNGHTATNYGQTDGAVVAINYPPGNWNWTQSQYLGLWRSTWKRKL